MSRILFWQEGPAGGPIDLTIAQEQGAQEQHLWLDVLIQGPSQGEYSTTPIPTRVQREKKKKAKVRTGLTIQPEWQQAGDVVTPLPGERVRTELSVHQVQRSLSRQRSWVYAEDPPGAMELTIVQVQGAQPEDRWQPFTFIPRLEINSIEAWQERGDTWPRARSSTPSAPRTSKLTTRSQR